VTSYLNSAENAGENIPWSKVATAIPNRTGIQCQARWTEALDPTVRKGRWKKEEDELLRSGVERFGCCWIRVAGYIPSRTQRQCRTRWNQLQSKQNRITTTTKKKTKLKPNTELPVRFHLQTRKDAIVIPSEILSPPSSPLTEATCPSPVSDYSTDSGSISAADATQILDMYDACFNHYLMNFDEPSNFLSLHLS
jgi:hypothetical protein